MLCTCQLAEVQESGLQLQNATTNSFRTFPVRVPTPRTCFVKLGTQARKTRVFCMHCACFFFRLGLELGLCTLVLHGTRVCTLALHACTEVTASSMHLHVLYADYLIKKDIGGGSVRQTRAKHFTDFSWQTADIHACMHALPPAPGFVCHAEVHACMSFPHRG